MTTEEMIRAAKDALGADRTDDFIIQPSQHAKELAAKAPWLADTLERSELSVLAEQYERKDREANEAQLIFKTTASWANWAVLVTSCFSILMLIVGPLKSVMGSSAGIMLSILGACGVVSGGLGSMWVYRAREGKLLDRWMNARASAEILRRQYFEAVTNFDLPGGASPITPLLLAFEYFRRYQMDVQLAFYERRSRDHRQDADRVLRTTTLCVALASISAGLAAALSWLSPTLVSIAALGAAATALAAFAATKESVNQSRQNAELYSNTYDALTLLKRKLDDVRRAAAAGDREPVSQFVTAVHDLVTAEHKQWLAAAQGIQPVIEKLDDALAKLKSKMTGGDSSAAAASSLR